MEEALIHKTRKGTLVRSKSEVIIADLLWSKKIGFQYERQLIANDGSWKWPDFTIDEDMTGTICYWEHLGMLQIPSYKQKWENKLAWYRNHGIAPHHEGGGPNSTLIVTQDGPDGSISSADIEELADDMLT